MTYESLFGNVLTQRKNIFDLGSQIRAKKYSTLNGAHMNDVYLWPTFLFSSCQNQTNCCIVAKL